MTIDSNQDNKDKIKGLSYTYTAEKSCGIYGYSWELLYSGTNKEKANEVAKEHSNEYGSGKARVCTWNNGEIIELKYVKKDNE